jgi:hypothetical protein
MILVVGWGSSFIYAERISEKIQLNGFISQGYIYSTHNDFIPQASEDGSFEFNEIGLNFSVDVNKKLKLGFQLLARDFGNIGNHRIELDWGFADYRFANAFGIRVGKIKTPLGLFNEVRSTDPLFPTVLLPQSIYDETFRPVFVSYNGIGAYGKLDIGIGILNYHLFAGGVNHPGDTPYLWQIQNAVNRGLAAAGMSISPLEMETQFLGGGRLMWHTPLKGLRLGGSYVYLKTRYHGLLSIPFAAPITVFGSMKVSKFFLLSGEWTLGNFTLSAEYMELPPLLKLELFNEEILLTDEIQQSWYVMGAYVFADKLTLYGYYDRFLSDKGDTEGNSAVRLGLPNFFGWQKDIAFGARYDISFNWTLKAEWHIIDGVAKSAVFFPAYHEPKQKWNMLAFKMSYNF